MPHKGMKKLLKTERVFLLEKLVERKNSIEGADVKDFQAGKKRKEAFSDVTKEFNEEFPEATREISQVIDIWRRAKMNAKKEKTALMKSRKKTGGGPDTMEISKESNLVLSAIGDQIKPLKNAFDDDASDPEISSDTSEESDFEIDFNAKTEKKRSKAKKKCILRHGI